MRAKVKPKLRGYRRAIALLANWRQFISRRACGLCANSKAALATSL
jgi:hypothetical protein